MHLDVPSPLHGGSKIMIKRRRLELSYQTPTFTLTRHPEGVLGDDKLAKRSYVVRVIRGRFVGP
jgi:hypothetical protein